MAMGREDIVLNAQASFDFAGGANAERAKGVEAFLRHARDRRHGRNGGERIPVFVQDGSGDAVNAFDSFCTVDREALGA
jgi:hypothetical protein